MLEPYKIYGSGSPISGNDVIVRGRGGTRQLLGRIINYTPVLAFYHFNAREYKNQENENFSPNEMKINHLEVIFTDCDIFVP